MTNKSVSDICKQAEQEAEANKKIKEASDALEKKVHAHLDKMGFVWK